MSVTFTLARYEEIKPGETWLVMGSRCDHKQPESCCDDAALYFGWCEHAEASKDACGCAERELNVSNANAAKLVELLGYASDSEPEGELIEGLPLYGEIAGDDTADAFYARVVLALGLLDVATDDERGQLAISNGGGEGTGRALVVDCGRRPGYLRDRLLALQQLALAAMASDELIAWA